MIGWVYHNGLTGGTGKSTANQDLGIKVAHSIGTFFGQLLFGWAADHLGRKRMYGIELMIIMVGTLGQAVAGHSPGVSIYGVIIMWRFIMGMGIGGDYPLSAVITSEFASRRIRGRMMAAVFSAQGWGNFASAIVSLVVITAYKGRIHNVEHSVKSVDQVWRWVIGLGMVPATIALYFRLTIPETPRYTMDIERNIKQASQDVDTYFEEGRYIVDPMNAERAEIQKATWKDFRGYFGQWRYGKILLGTAWSWFALDIAFYGLGLNSSTILTTIGFGSVVNKKEPATAIYQTLHNVAVGNIILSVGGLLPGYYFTMAFVDSWGRKPIQLMGFSLLTIIFCAMGFGYDKMITHGTHSTKSAFVFLYCMANFFQNFGPNTTTFIVPGEVFPTRYRSTGHGISAASGKLGAIVAQVGFSRLIDIGGKTGSSHFLKHILEIFAFFMATGIASTLLLPETKGRTLEDLSYEDQDNFVRDTTVSAPTNGAEPLEKTGHQL